ncbi:MAG: hypothetical protein ACOYNI_01315 [Acidimicrobiia bacterium]
MAAAPALSTELVQRARARLDAAMVDLAPGSALVPGHAASYLFALARQSYLEVATAARTGSIAAMVEIERVMKEPTAVLAMGLHPTDLVLAVSDPERQFRIFESLTLTIDDYLEIRNHPWCEDVASSIDRRLLEVAFSRRDAQLAMVLSTSRDEAIAIEALALTGRALNRELVRAASRPVEDPLRSLQTVMNHVENLRQWLNDVRQRDNEQLGRLATAIERRAVRARAAAARSIGVILLEEIAALYGAPVLDVSAWARKRQHILTAAERWRRELAVATPGIQSLATAVSHEVDVLSANGIGWAMRSHDAITEAVSRQHRTTGLMGLGITAVVCCAPIALILLGASLTTVVPILVVLGGLVAVFSWEMRELKAPGAWFTFYAHPLTEEGGLLVTD